MRLWCAFEYGTRKMRSFPDPSILLHPQIPKPLHLLNPRTILGKEWWDENRKQSYVKHDLRCHACGILKYDAKYVQWLECHEMYDIDYTTGRVEFVELVALCHSCHNFIHNGRMAMLVQKGEMEAEKFEYVMARGSKLLELSGIVDDRASKLEELRAQGKLCSWGDYHLVINGVNYGLRFKTLEEWEEHWGVSGDKQKHTIHGRSV